jgi:hypothetical protein
MWLCPPTSKSVRISKMGFAADGGLIDCWNSYFVALGNCYYVRLIKNKCKHF